MASTDARPVVRKGEAARLYSFINDSNGDIIDSPAGLAAEVSLDGAGESSITSAPTLATFTKRVILELTASETNADHVAIELTSTTTGAKPTQIDIYPEEAGDIRVNVTQFDGNAVNTTNSRPEVVAERLGTQAKADVNAEADTALVDYDAVVPADLPANFADLAITASTGKVTVGTNDDKTGYEISGTINTLDGLNDPTAGDVADAVWDEARSGHTSSGSFGEGVASVQGNVTGSVASLTANNDKTGYSLSASGIDDIFDEAVDGTRTLRQLVRGMASALMGKLSGADTNSIKIRDLDDTKDRIDAQVDGRGNRDSVTLDLS